MTSTLVRTSSHRAREKLTRLLGYKPQSYVKLSQAGYWQEVPNDTLTEALKIKGVKAVLRKPEGLMKCR